MELAAKFPLPRNRPSGFEKITPDMAREWVSRNIRNRQVSPNLVREYAAAMSELRWKPNGESIIFGTDGSLLDGQHRLLACIQANVPFESLVVYDVDPDWYDTINIGRRRTAGDVLSMEGYKYAKNVGAAVRWLFALERGVVRNVLRVSTDVIRAYVNKHPDLVESVATAHPASHVLAAGIGGALHYLFKRHDTLAANRFFADLSKGAYLHYDDPVYVLRERLLSDRQSKSRLLEHEIIALCIRAWNHRRSGRPTRTLKGAVRAADGSWSYPDIE